jgi:uncharacterized protein YndB with AHSA1/START domain
MTESIQPAVAVVQRVLPASPEVVYDEWLDADGMREWMCPRPARPTFVALDTRVGGNLRIDIDDEGSEVSVTGRYLALDRPHRIQFTWNWTASEPAIPDSIVTVILEPHPDGQTLMTIHHAQLPPDLVERYQSGWAGVARQLAGRVIDNQ